MVFSKNSWTGFVQSLEFMKKSGKETLSLEKMLKSLEFFLKLQQVLQK